MHKTRVKTTISKRDFSHFDEDLYLSSLENKISNISKHHLDTNNKYDSFHTALIQTLDEHAPYKKISRKESKLKLKPWLTKGILKSIKLKNILYKKFIRNKDPFIYTRYKTYRDKINKLTKLSKKNYYQAYFNKYKNNSKKIWSGIKEITNKIKQTENQNISLHLDGITITDQELVANKFCNFFTTIATNLVKKLPNKQVDYKKYLNNPIVNSFFTNPIESNEITTIISKMDINKSCDIYGISPKILKISERAITPVLTNIFNRSFQEGVFPTKLKYAKIVPIFKGGSKLDVSNYRPISLLPIISKVLERLMYNRLISFIEKYNVIFEHQFGFQKNKSTTLAIMDLYHKIIDSMENKKTPSCIFLDFAKAFDTVNHNILLNKLEYYGIRGTSLNWFKSYLNNRIQRVSIGSILSENKTLLSGVPQGSILGPLLFLLYINDIQHSSNILKFHLFADDTSIFHSHTNLDILESEINTELLNTTDWLIANKLSLNVKKSSFMTFSSKQCKSMRPLSIKILEQNLEEKSATKYLGIIIDKHLNWSNHMHLVNQKINKGTGMIAKLRHYVPPNILRQTYYALIHSHLNYGITIWGFGKKKSIDEIITSTKKVIRIMLFKNKYNTITCMYEHANPLFNLLKILNFENSLKLTVSDFIWQIKNNKLPTIIQNLFQHKSHKYHTRQNFTLPYAKTNFLRNSLFFNGIKLWNEGVPTYLKQSPDTICFKKRYKKIISESQGFSA